ncbi:ATP-binding cassette domain-containing protein [Bradyrhizobium diazoefficiens]|uniref:ATP-binding cassette domain-containing protein n=1 Tax=Bradyrhizobium diazoefficiens TaxID=1355477 RepID=UPI00190C91D5|nr:ATP-binding cassette domain-containing protein [Bradyrhizobium diazoefficiens]MBK3662691.1 ATP-binding cassette domain-containing protein [Bradyrhizobium diazoefficiens]
MTVVLYEGPNFSGRSDALRNFAWNAGTTSGSGQYLNSLLDNNLSGLARSVRGELRLHRAQKLGRIESSTAIQELIGYLSPDQTIMSLSGGETVRLLIACAIALQPERIAIDGLLEQLDRRSRPAIGDVLSSSKLGIEFHVSDNDPQAITTLFDRHIKFERGANSVDLNSRLLALSERVSQQRVSAPSLGLEGLCFSYPSSNRPVFDRADYSFQPGRPYILKAPNGAGKSTLARLLCGVLAPQSGRLDVAGQSFSPHRSRDNLIFYAFQNPLDQIFGTTTRAYLDALSNVAAQRKTFLAGKIGLTTDDVLAGLGITPFAEAEPFELPFVVAKRLSLAGALLARSPWIFLDEPALSSDADGRAGLRHLVQALCEAGFGTIIVSHGEEFDGLPHSTPVTIQGGKIREGV